MKPTAATSSASRESSEFEFVSSSVNSSSGATSTSPTTSQPKTPTSSTPSASSLFEEGGPSTIFGWVKGTGGGLLSRVAEKTKSSVESVITTLDPQMKEYIYSGGDFRFVVASDKDVKVSPVREAFQAVLGKATVFGLPAQSVSVAEQPVGFAAGKMAATERIQSLQSKVEVNDVIIGVESFLLEVGDDEWVELSCLKLSDKSRDISLTTFSQMTAIDARFVHQLKEATGESYPKSWSGFAVTIGSVLEKELNVAKERWHEAVCGLSRREILFLAAKSLASTYKKCLLAKVETI